ncbi:TIGR04255 family protein [Pseudomonas sp. 382]|uniref:TIGR04255 family protein n=1 Tax=Pseudomonas sp. 382 TaxID=1751969 RepID=UPI001304619D|nr:TIGR04255 family protein [Pseudomonas sp. 382]
MLKPIFEAHSIESISLTCEYDGAVDAHGLSVIKDEGSRLKLKYSARRVARKSANPNAENHSSQPEVKGYLFLNRDGDREKSRFEVINSNCVYTSKNYINFKTFLADAAFSLKIGHEAFSKSGRRLEKIILSYKDQFVTTNSEEVLEGVNPACPYIASACLNQNNFWHSNVGFFSQDFGDETTLLHNIRIHHSLVKDNDFDDEDTELTHALIVECHHVLGMSDEDVSDFENTFEDTSNRLRSTHKEMLLEILSADLISAIGLKKEKAEG